MISNSSGDGKSLAGQPYQLVQTPCRTGMTNTMTFAPVRDGKTAANNTAIYRAMGLTSAELVKIARREQP